MILLIPGIEQRKNFGDLEQLGLKYIYPKSRVSRWVLAVVIDESGQQVIRAKRKKGEGGETLFLRHSER